MISVFVHEGGVTRQADAINPAWLKPDSTVWVWVDLSKPSSDEARILTDVFHFHELAVEDALAETHYPKIESYGDYLYLILHGIDFKASEHLFKTQDIDFFLGERYLVTVHPGISRSMNQVSEVCGRSAHVLGEGPTGLLHRIVDTMVDNYLPEVEKLNERLDEIEKEVFEHPNQQLVRRILDFKRDVSSLRRVVLPERDAVGRLARREFALISEAMSYRFRDVHDHLVRLADEAMFFQDRITSLLDAYLSNVSNQLNSVMKVLTVIATIFMPLTVLTGMWGMNVPLPHLPGNDAAQFWWIVILMLATSAVMLWFFRRKGWI
ncbi:MAG TPA: magnesium/cobalt transporter CorA [Vicinamibacterales bacterium]|nr:magnesium/cobalt transporter CorA [Vicinamibacterales bacterium]